MASGRDIGLRRSDTDYNTRQIRGTGYTLILESFLSVKSTKTLIPARIGGYRFRLKEEWELVTLSQLSHPLVFIHATKVDASFCGEPGRHRVPISPQAEFGVLLPISERESVDRNKFRGGGLISIVHHETVERDLTAGEFGNVDTAQARRSFW